jgi:hypothetical protein
VRNTCRSRFGANIGSDDKHRLFCHCTPAANEAHCRNALETALICILARTSAKAS